MLQCVAVCCSVLQCGAVCCSVVQCIAVRCSVSTHCDTLHHTAPHCTTLQHSTYIHLTIYGGRTHCTYTLHLLQQIARKGTALLKNLFSTNILTPYTYILDNSAGDFA